MAEIKVFKPTTDAIFTESQTLAIKDQIIITNQNIPNGLTVLYTVPAGKTFFITSAYIDGTFSGTNANYNECYLANYTKDQIILHSSGYFEVAPTITFLKSVNTMSLSRDGFIKVNSGDQIIVFANRVVGISEFRGGCGFVGFLVDNSVGNSIF